MRVDPVHRRTRNVAMTPRDHRKPRKTRRSTPLRIMVIVAAVWPSLARAEEAPAPTPASLTQILSCRSRDALGLLAERLFLANDPPAWMHPIEPPKALEGMIGLYGFSVDGDVSLFGEPVDHIYFMKDWVVALLPRARVERLIRARKMQRAPIAITEQYYRFVDPEVGPMIGAFAPTGDALAKMLIDAFGDDPAAQAATPPPPAPAMLLVGCNYTVASQADFLAAARDAGETTRKAGADLRRMAKESQSQPAR